MKLRTLLLFAIAAAGTAYAVKALAKNKREPLNLGPVDPIDQEIDDSFPASDPPSWTSGSPSSDQLH
ncbi:hypothetical protein [Bdellovibrio sp. NC01]|uniref:hypothetical protein n=1 Tax=Bdellovibrio sp. NC01 TaxID=2220073 RepID=UPI001158E805|nr:hypothetical protein [Bdellovibrio sp. NC01]QDK38001.1 hypothetical protein DOE51_10575 [Bdellovibrio sp. NC01]